MELPEAAAETVKKDLRDIFGMTPPLLVMMNHF